jgi:CHAT domain-containing protein
VWAITREAFEFRPLPPEAELHREIQAFVKAVREDSSAAAIRGGRLHDLLFGSISPGLRQRPTWVLALDGPLFDLPFAALVQTSTTEPRQYLIERHAIRIVPGISALFRSPPAESNEFFVGVGDPIYNRADPRWPDATRARADQGMANPVISSTGRILELPRLMGSAREIESCANIWRANGQKVVVLTGAQANKDNLADALQQNPSVLHVAAHVVFPSNQAGPGMVALGLQPGKQMELLSATETASVRGQLGLVVLDGCSSAHGPILPGAGLMGMTRAWLAAGARAVIATRWATADQDSGEVFSSLYRLYFAQRPHHPMSFGRLLREAQLGELSGGGPRAAPAYWATYFCVETN